MNRKGIVIFLLLLSAVSVRAQSTVAIFDESVHGDTMVSDTIVADTMNTAKDILKDIHLVVEEPVQQEPMLPSDSLVSDSAATPALSSNPIYYWSDVRDVRYSLKQTMRSVRDSMRMGVRSMRDSVRNDLREVARKRPHELRVGWGDQIFESLVWYNKPYYTLYPESFIGEYDENYRYAQHWFVEYQYRIKYWFNFGVMIDYSGVLWDKVQRNGHGTELKREKNCHFHNIAALLTMRFTYVHTKYVQMYSGLGAGLNINTGSEIDYWGRKTVIAPALNLTVLGMSVGNEQWFGAIEFGGLYSLMNSNEVYLAGSRMLTASVGVRL